MNFPNGLAPNAQNDTNTSLLFKICQLLYNEAQSGEGGGMVIPNNDYQAFTYYGSTNNIQTIVYKTGGSSGTTVATQTFTYVGGGASDDDDVASITLS